MREVLRGVGFLLHVPGLMALLSVPVAWLSGEAWALPGLLLTALAALGSGQALIWTTRGVGPFRRYQSMLIAAISWALIALVGALPFWLAGLFGPNLATLNSFQSPPQAIFESVSGFTSTGLTIIAHPSELPMHLQWWRSFSQWVGGIGVILLLLAILPAERGALNLYFSEAREEKILPTVKSTVRAIWLIYVGYTLVAIGLLWLAGEPVWRAVNHGMTAIATGGFTITDDSLMSASVPVKIVYIPIMIAGAISFLVHYRLIVERVPLSRLWQLTELRLMVWITAGGAVALWLERGLPLEVSGLVDTVFVWVSAITTTGFAAADLSRWADAALLLVLLAVLMGGMTGSTGGGVKLLRVGLLLKDLLSQLRSLRATPHEMVTVQHDGQRLPPDEVANLGRIAARLVGIFMLLWLLGVFTLLHWLPEDTRLAHVFFDTASALFNSGLSTGLAGPGLDSAGALVLSLLMLLGRLEIFPLLVLVAWVMGRR